MKNLTKQAEKALKLAREAAVQMKHGYIGTEHMLLGLLREEEGTAGQVLRDAKVEDKTLSDLIMKLIAPSSVAVEPGIPEMSPRAKSILFWPCCVSQTVSPPGFFTPWALIFRSCIPR